MNFTYVFYQHIMFRHSCGKCHFCNTTRPSDITIADFWGWEKTDPNFNQDDKGCSLVFVNTSKGREIFEAVKDKLNTIPAELDNCLQPNLQHPSAIHPKRMQFEKDYSKRGFNYVMNKYGDVGWRYKARIFKQKVKSIIIRMVKNTVQSKFHNICL